MTPFGSKVRLNKIACLGAGYVGGPTMAMIAAKCPHVEVHVADISEQRIAAWNSSALPIFEPGLSEIVEARRGKNLFFTTDVARCIRDCDIIFVCVNTPTKTFGVGRGCAANMSTWELAARDIAEYAECNKIVIEKSTVPVRTAEALKHVLEANERPGVQFVILSNPEFLAEGTAIRDLTNPDRVLIGGPEHHEAGKFALNTLVDIYGAWVPRERILTTNVWSSELSKLVANAFLAQRISSINAVSALCERTGANVMEVSRSIGTDSRIGSKFLNASVGFGGSCFQKDILNLVYLCETYNLPEVAAYFRGVIEMNNFQKDRFAAGIIRSMFSTVHGKRIAIFGFAYKKNTGDTRDTPALDICQKLLNEKAILQVYDPKVTREAALQEFRDHGITEYDFQKNFLTMTGVEEACHSAHAIVILTEWDEFKTVDYHYLYTLMKKPAFVFDGRNILDHVTLTDIGFTVKSIGQTLPSKSSGGFGWAFDSQLTDDFCCITTVASPEDGDESS